MIKAIPMRRVGEHIELANLAAFLVSDGAAYINGDAIVIDDSVYFTLDALRYFICFSQLFGTAVVQ